MGGSRVISKGMSMLYTKVFGDLVEREGIIMKRLFSSVFYLILLANI